MTNYERYRETHSRVKARRRAAGLCLSCGGERDRDGLTHCSGCAARMKGSSTKSYRARVDTGLCGMCGAPPLAGKKRCGPCTERARAKRDSRRISQLRDERVAKGLCVTCGESNDGDTQVCQPCAEPRRAYMRQYQSARRLSDIQFKLADRLRSRIGNAMRDRKMHYADKAGSAVADLGCTLGELVEHLRVQFSDGMSWENHGEWHIDHIEPLAGFDLTDREQFKRAAHFTNLQPLWASENLRKHAKAA